jgi:hypothetical protein
VFDVKDHDRWAGLLFALLAVACGPSVAVYDEAVAFGEGATDEPGLRAFAKVDPNWVAVYVTDSPRATCDDPTDVRGDLSRCPEADSFMVKLFVAEPFEVPGTFAAPEPLGTQEWYADANLCGAGHSSGADPMALLVLDSTSDEHVDGSATFMGSDRRHDVVFSAPICPPEE